MTVQPDLIVMHDPDDPRWHRIKGGPNFGRVLEGARAILKAHGAEYLTDREVWVLPAAAWPRVETELRTEGYTFDVRTWPGARAARRAPVECRACGQPYRARAIEGRPCGRCGHTLVLVTPPDYATAQPASG